MHSPFFSLKQPTPSNIIYRFLLFTKKMQAILMNELLHQVSFLPPNVTMPTSLIHNPVQVYSSFPGDIRQIVEIRLSQLGKWLLASRGYRTGMLLDTLQCIGQPPTTKNYLTPNVNSAKVEKSALMLEFLMLPLSCPFFLICP